MRYSDTGGTRIRTITGVFPGLFLLAGCASQPDEAAPASARFASPAVGTPMRSAGTAPVADGTGTGVDLDLIKRGFRARQRNGQLKYCRTQVLTGTHFSNTVCYTADEIHAQDANTKADLDMVNRRGHSPCPNNKCD